MVEKKGREAFKEELIKNAHHIGRPGFGILAADESTGTMGKRLDQIQVENTEENRRYYRELLFTTPGFEDNISGVIMFEETLHQKAKDGTNFVELLKSKGVLPGIKVDKGVVVIGGSKCGENATTGLDGLEKRCADFYAQGCRFAKWRAVLKIEGTCCPSPIAITENAHTLARYGAICQDNGLVPIIEPEILCDGPHTIERCAEASEEVFAAVMKAMLDQKLIIEGCMLKPNMVTPGSTCTERKSAGEIAWYTVRTLRRTISPALPSVVFLSGGQSEEEASQNLNEMNKIDKNMRPWNLSFSYGRALQSSTLKAWKGKEENHKAAQEAFITRAKGNSDATKGSYAGGGESTSLHVANYAY